MSVTVTVRSLWASRAVSATGGSVVVGRIGPPGTDGAAGPNSISDTTALGTLTDAVADALSLLATNAVGTAARKVAITSVVRAILQATTAAQARAAIGLTDPDPSPAGSYTLASVTVDSTGRVTAASSGSASDGTWGSITGTLSAQTDLQSALNAKQPLDSDLTSWAGVTRSSGYDTFAATPTSANLAALLTDETGSGAAVFSASPTFTGTVVLSGATTSLGAAAQAHTLQQVAPASGAGNSLVIAASAAASGNTAGGSVVLLPGAGSGSGVRGAVQVGTGYGVSTLRFGSGSIGTSSDAPCITTEVVSPLGGFSGLTFRRGDATNLVDIYALSTGAKAISYVFDGTNYLFRANSSGAQLPSSSSVVWSGTASANGTASVGFCRNADGVAEINNGTASTYRDLILRNLTASAGTITLGVFTVATLPSASANAGAFAQVTDSNSTTNGTTVAGGGANRVPVFSNGTNWIIK